MVYGCFVYIVDVTIFIVNIFIYIAVKSDVIVYMKIKCYELHVLQYIEPLIELRVLSL